MGLVQSFLSLLVSLHNQSINSHKDLGLGQISVSHHRVHLGLAHHLVNQQQVQVVVDLANYLITTHNNKPQEALATFYPSIKTSKIALSPMAFYINLTKSNLNSRSSPSANNNKIRITISLMSKVVGSTT